MRRMAQVAVLIVGLMPPVSAWALDTGPRLYGTSEAAYWEVGTVDRELSRMCREGLFNQRHVAELYISFTGEKGRGLVGIAKQDYNLIDPRGKALPDVSYFFYNDGTSQCRVYTAQ